MHDNFHVAMPRIICMMIDIHMGHSQTEKAESHERIVRIAAARFRKFGLDGLSVADLMKDAGLTHGGFYRHFESREALVTEAVVHALAEADGQIGVERRPPDDQLTLARQVDAYLAEAHRDAPDRGCAVAALVSDAARAGAGPRSAFSHQVKRSIQGIARLLPKDDEPTKRAHALFIWCAMVGAIALARAVNDRKLSSEILETVRAEIKSRFGGGEKRKRADSGR